MESQQRTTRILGTAASKNRESLKFRRGFNNNGKASEGKMKLGDFLQQGTLIAGKKAGRNTDEVRRTQAN